jgi:hypothetical protein
MHHMTAEEGAGEEDDESTTVDRTATQGGGDPFRFLGFGFGLRKQVSRLTADGLSPGSFDSTLSDTLT